MKYIMANAKRYGPNENVLFMMEADDYRLTDENDNWTRVMDGERRGSTFMAEDGSRWRVYPDWSLEKLATGA